MHFKKAGSIEFDLLRHGLRSVPAIVLTNRGKKITATRSMLQN